MGKAKEKKGRKEIIMIIYYLSEDQNIIPKKVVLL